LTFGFWALLGIVFLLMLIRQFIEKFFDTVQQVKARKYAYQTERINWLSVWFLLYNMATPRRGGRRMGGMGAGTNGCSKKQLVIE
jgi:hypothetical protein